MTRLLFTIYFSLLVQITVFAQDCEVIRYNTSCTLTDDKLESIDSVLIQVNNRMGENYTTFAFNYSKMDKISSLKAWIEDMNGNVIRSLKNSDIKDQSAISDYSLYEDNFIKYFQLKHNEYPYRIFYTCQTTSKQFIGEYWRPVHYYNVPIKKGELTLVVPKNKSVKLLAENCKDFRADSINEFIRYRWTAEYSKRYAREEFSPPFSDFSPKVTVTPVKFTYGPIGNSTDWKSFGNWYCDLLKGLDDLTDTEKQNIDRMIKGLTDKKEIVRILYHYLQDHMRYINVSFKIGGFKPYPASYVCENKYGDCKALTTYMHAALEYAGISSLYTIVELDDEPSEVNANYASAHYFNHMILTVPMEKDTLWLENTSNYLPFGYVHNLIQNRQALLIDKDNSHLIRIPAMKNYATSRVADFRFDDTPNADVLIHYTLKSDDFDDFVTFPALKSREDQTEALHNYLPFTNFELKDWNLKKFNRDSTFMILSAHLSLNKYIKDLGEERYFDIVPSRLYSFTPLQYRTLPVQIYDPYITSDTIRYILSEGYQLKSIPKEISMECRFGRYLLKVNNHDSFIEVVKYFELYPGKYTLSEYKDMTQFLTSIKEAEKAKLIIRKIN